MRSLKVILTDLDGVIRHWDSDTIHAKEIEYGLEPGYLYSICFEEKLLAQVVTGQISDLEWRNRVQAKLSSSMGEALAKALVAAWENSEVHIDKAIMEFYRDHFPSAKVVLVTNATSRLNQDMEAHGLDTVFDSVLNSSELGCAKPSHSYFNKVMRQLGVGFDEVIYVDDSATNIQSATKLGIRSHHYQNHAQLVEFLVKIKGMNSSNFDDN
jgi:putative hydrolase of the HAD superfamily